MKLDPRSIPYRALRRSVQWAVGAGTIGLVLTRAFEVQLGPPIVIGAIAVAGLAGMGWSVAYHRRFEFELTPDSIDITSGVVSRRTRKIPLRRIQNVDIRQGLVPRLLGVAEVRFETAGGQGTEASLRFVDLGIARELQKRVDRHGETGGEPIEDEPDGEQPEPAETPLYAISSVELGLLSVTSIDWRAVGFVVLAAVGILPDQPTPGGGITPLAPFALLAQPVVLTGAALVGNAALLTARFYRFRLWRAGETLRYERGLLRRFSGSIPLDRVHLLRFRDNPATRRLGFAALDIQTAGYGPETEGGSAAAVPIADRQRVLDLARSVEPFPDLDLERPPKRARQRYLVRYSVAALLLTGGLFVADQVWRSMPWFLGFGLLLATPVAAHLTWKHRGWALGERALLVRAGFWRRITYVVPLYRVQTVGTSASVFQRRRELASVQVDTASGAPTVHDLDETVARELREAVAEGLKRDRVRRRTDRPDGSPMSGGEVGGTAESSGIEVEPSGERPQREE